MPNQFSVSLFINGEKIAGDATAASAGEIAVLAGVNVHWGRENTTEQPGPSTMAATLGLGNKSREWSEKLRIGTPIRLSTTGKYTTDSGEHIEQEIDVFNGRITQIDIQADNAFTSLAKISAADWLASAANTIIGLPPRPAETAQDRLNAYLEAANLGIKTVWDNGITATLASRDVDAQPLDSLISTIATSCDAVMWPITKQDGPYLRFENVDQRVSLKSTTLEDGKASIGENIANLDILPAKAIMKNPVTFSRTPEGLTTLISVRWIEETTDENGKPVKTDRTEHVQNTRLEKIYGRRSISVSTELNNHIQASVIASKLSRRVVGETWRVNGLTWIGEVGPVPLTLNLLDESKRSASPYAIKNLETWAPKETLVIFVEGGTYRWDGNQWKLELNASTPPTGAGKSAIWSDPPPSYTWDAFTALSWTNMQGTQITPMKG